MTPEQLIRDRYRDAETMTNDEEVIVRHTLCIELARRYTMSSRDIAPLLNMHESTVRYVLNKYGLPPRQVPPIAPDVREKIARLESRGVKPRLIAEMCGVSISTVRKNHERIDH